MTNLLAGVFGGGPGTQAFPATVSALREDGTVNLSYMGAVVLGAVCLKAYTNRAVGDRVAIVYLNGMYTVIGEYGGDPGSYSPPPNAPVAYINYTQVTGAQTASSGSRPPQQGCTGADANNSDPLLPAFTYFNGATNSLTSVGAGITTIKLWVARSTDGGGTSRSVFTSVFPHAFNALPGTGFTYQTTFTRVQFGLERGEVKVVSLPSDWVTAIKAGTIKGVCMVPGTPTNPLDAYSQYSLTTGGFSAS